MRLGVWPGRFRGCVRKCAKVHYRLPRKWRAASGMPLFGAPGSPAVSGDLARPGANASAEGALVSSILRPTTRPVPASTRIVNVTTPASAKTQGVSTEPIPHRAEAIPVHGRSWRSRHSSASGAFRRAGSEGARTPHVKRRPPRPVRMGGSPKQGVPLPGASTAQHRWLRIRPADGRHPRWEAVRLGRPRRKRHGPHRDRLLPGLALDCIDRVRGNVRCVDEHIGALVARHRCAAHAVAQGLESQANVSLIEDANALPKIGRRVEGPLYQDAALRANQDPTSKT